MQQTAFVGKAGNREAVVNSLDNFVLRNYTLTDLSVSQQIRDPW